MASVRKHKKGWLCEVRRKPDFYKSKLFATRHDAQEWGFNVERGLEINTSTRLGHTIRNAVERYRDEETPKKKGAKHETNALNRLLQSPLMDITLDDANARDFQRWIDKRVGQVKADSVRREFATLRTVLRTAKRKWHWTGNEAFKDVDLPRASRPRDRIITKDELALVLEALGHSSRVAATPRQEIALCALLAIETGMRQGEIWRLKWEDVHLKAQYVTLHDTKNTDSRNVPLSKKAVQCFAQFPTRHGRVVTVPQTTGEAMWRRAVRRAGIENLRFHDLRHTAITRLAQKLTMLELARMVGHRDPRSLMGYYNETATELAKKLD